jgi:hypothetical protein
MTEVFMIVVLDLAGGVVDVIGPFWDEASAEGFGKRNVSRFNYAWKVRPLRERGEWLAEAVTEWAEGK